MRGLRGRPRSVVLGGDALAAHAHVDPGTGRLVTFSHHVRLGLRGPVTRVTVYEFDEVGVPHSCRAARSRRDPLPCGIGLQGVGFQSQPPEASTGAGHCFCR